MTNPEVEQIWRWLRVIAVLVVIANVIAIVVAFTLSPYPQIAIVNVVGLIVAGTSIRIAWRSRQRYVRRQQDTSE